MRKWWLLATRNWRRKWGRSAGTVVAIAIGSMLVVAVTTCYESGRSAITGYFAAALGRSDVHIRLRGYADWNLPQSLRDRLQALPDAELVVGRLSGLMKIRGPDFDRRAPETTSTFSRQDVLLVDLVGQEGIDERFRPLRIDPGRPLLPEDDAQNVCLIERQLADDYGLKPGDRIMILGENNLEELFEIVGITNPPRLGRMQRRTVYIPLQAAQRLRGLDQQISTIDLISRSRLPEQLKTQAQQAVAEFAGQLRADLDQARRQLADLQAQARQPDPPDIAASVLQQRIAVATQRVRELERADAGATSIDVATRESKVKQVDKSMSLVDLVLKLTAMVSLLAATFIIFSTLNISVNERIAQLGTLRCIGMTRSQLATLVFAEVMPLGLLGVAAGVPLGLLVAWLAVHAPGADGSQTGTDMPAVFGEFTISYGGIWLAGVGGLVATALAAAVPAYRAAWVSPMEASSPLARPDPPRAILWYAVVGVLVFAGAAGAVRAAPPEWAYVLHLSVAIPLQLLSVVMMTPGLIAVVCAACSRGVAWVLGLPHALLSEHLGRLHRRSTATACALIVGLTLLVNLRVNVESLVGMLELPTQFPNAVVFFAGAPTLEQLDRIGRRVPGSTDYMPMAYQVSELLGIPPERRPAMFSRLGHRNPQINLVSVDPAQMRARLSLDFLQGDADTAYAALAAGEGVIVTREFAEGFSLGLGDRIELRKASLGGFESGSLAAGALAWLEGAREPRSYRIAGVITSPAIEILAHFYDQSYAIQERAIGGVLIGRSAAEADFGMRSYPVVLFDFDYDRLPGNRGPAEAEAAERALRAQAGPGAEPDPARVIRLWGRVGSADYGFSQERFGDRLIVERSVGGDEPLEYRFDSVQAMREARPELFGVYAGLYEDRVVRLFSGAGGIALSVGNAKRILENDMRLVFAWLTVAAGIALASAAVGAANVMLANVVNRSRQFAVMRAVGTTRGQVIRLVLAEGLVLGVAGCILGLASGFYLAWTAHLMIWQQVAFSTQLRIPWWDLSLAMVGTVSACLLAAAIPARRAAGVDIIQAMRV